MWVPLYCCYWRLPPSGLLRSRGGKDHEGRRAP